MNTESIQDIISIIKRWGKKIIVYSLLAGVVTAVATFFMPNYYKATTVFYPGNLLLASPSPVGYGDKDRYPFGKGDDLDRLFAVGQSNELFDHLLEKFKLADHYKMDDSSLEKKGKIIEHLKSLFSISKNKYEAVELAYEDKDREMATKVANEAREYIARKIGNMVMGSSNNTVSAFETTLINQDLLAIRLADTIKLLKNTNNIIQSTAQGSALAEILVNVENELVGSLAKVDFYKNKPIYIDSLVKYQAFSKSYQSQKVRLRSEGSAYVSVVNEIYKLEVEYDKLITQIAIDKERLKGLKSMSNGDFAVVHTVDVAKVPLKKSRPMRSVLVLASMVIVGLFLILSMIILESLWFRSLFNAGKSS
jgi:hypothetical protein